MQTFIARQPIFDRKQKVYGYELLFRSGLENFFNHPDVNEAASRVIADSVLLLDLAALTAGRMAFVNVTRDVLLNGYVDFLPRRHAVVELLESVEVDEDVVDACARLKSDGYRLALDDFVYDRRYDRLLELADFVKVDFLATRGDDRGSLARELSSLDLELLAEKVETHEDLRQALDLGYQYFQGFFFDKPQVLSARNIPALKLHYMRILQEIHRKDLDFASLEETIKREMSLCYKLLRYVNSVSFAWRNEIDSIKRALVLLGENEIRKLVSLVALASMAEDKPEELVVHATVRAKFCEEIGSCAGLEERSEDLFLMGMFSLIDAILDRPMTEILAELPIRDDVRAALLGERSPFRDVYEYVLAYERGQWEHLDDRGSRIGLDDAAVCGAYRSAVTWCHEALRAL